MTFFIVCKYKKQKLKCIYNLLYSLIQFVIQFVIKSSTYFKIEALGKINGNFYGLFLDTAPLNNFLLFPARTIDEDINWIDHEL